MGTLFQDRNLLTLWQLKNSNVEHHDVYRSKSSKLKEGSSMSADHLSSLGAFSTKLPL